VSDIRIYRLSERALTIEWPAGISRATSAKVLHTDRRIREKPFGGWIENVPAYHTLTVYYDPVLLDVSLENFLLQLAEEAMPEQVKGRLVEIPVHYEVEKAPDLVVAAGKLGMTVRELAELHSKQTYHVFMLGFMPGFPYMGELPESMVLPRKAVPEKRVPAGMVAIAGKQTGIYPFDSPGGWYGIGWTPLKMFENGRSLLEPGDEVKFIPQWR
jgi:inhibitor of KinA